MMPEHISPRLYPDPSRGESKEPVKPNDLLFDL
jgi:hypothetical protein